jgi:diguanylate cyclase (GGDEF)-like protein
MPVNNNFFSRWYKRQSLGVLSILFTLILSLSIGQVLDFYQSQSVQNLVKQNLERQLKKELSDARIRLNNYIQRFTRLSSSAVYMINNINVNYKKTFPLPSHFWSNNIEVDFAFIVNNEGILLNEQKTRHKKQYLPIYPVAPHLLALTENDTYLLNINQHPVLLSSQVINHNGQTHHLVIGKYLDNQFLSASQNYALSSGRIVALFDTNNEQPFASSINSNNNLSLEQLNHDYILAGKDFFDYGSSELAVKFALLIDRDTHTKLTNQFLSIDRKNRFITIILMALVLLIAMLSLSKVVSRLSKRIAQRANDVFDGEESFNNKGNEIYLLYAIFDRFIARTISPKDLEAKENKIEKQTIQFLVLDAITKQLNVGIVLCANNICYIENDIMESFVQQCGTLDLFTRPHQLQSNLALIDFNGNERIFEHTEVQLKNNRKALLIQDVTEAHNTIKKLEHMALHDILTGLPNRALLNDRIETALNVANREEHLCYLFLMDLDRFKDVNDTLGHNIGDILLQQVSARMTDCVRMTDTLCRLGGDEFSLLLCNSTQETIFSIANKINKSVSKIYHINGNNVEIGISIGISESHKNISSDTFMSQADIAMYDAKRKKTGMAFFTDEIDTLQTDRLLLIQEIKQGIDNNEFILHYQPQISLKNDSISFKALARWNHPRLKLLLPDEFITIAEENGLIHTLTCSLFSQAVKQCKNWHQDGLTPSISINLSTANLLDIGFPVFMAITLDEHDISPSQITLEINESILADDIQQIMQTLHNIQEMGIKLSIKGFGTVGYSSLAYLNNISVNELKIDRSFIMKLQDNQSDLTIVKSIIEIAHNLNIDVAAEGIETEFQKELLDTLGCERLQGYLFSKPMPPEKVIEWLKEQ